MILGRTLANKGEAALSVSREVDLTNRRPRGDT
jgi:hypothetical protein